MRRHIDKIEGAKHERGYVYNFHYHLIWCTKYRKQLFTTPELAEEMKNLQYSQSTERCFRKNVSCKSSRYQNK